MRLILIRHGDSEHHHSGVIADVGGCTGLTKRGVDQVQALASRLSRTGELRDCTTLLSSPVLRARQTADILATVLQADSIEESTDLCELRPGVADGLSFDNYQRRFGSFDLPTSPNRPFAPGGESWLDFLGRVRAAHQRLTERFADGTVVAVSHASFVVASLLVLFDIPRPGTGAYLEPTHTSITEWQFTKGVWTLLRYNDAFHLLDGPGR